MIPEQLKDKKFCRIHKQEKKPYEKGWTCSSFFYEQQPDKSWKHKITGKTYTIKNEDKAEIYKGPNKDYSLQEITPYIEKENFGVLTGINGLAVLDDDTKDKKFIDMFINKFGKTFRVRNHLYVKIKNWDCQKIIFYDEEGHAGELQGEGQQVVGPGSIHPSGEIYDVRDDLPIIEVEYKDIIEFFSPFLKQKKKIIKVFKKTNWQGDKVNNIPITNIISLVGLTDMGGGCYQGCHPVHGSTNGMNFRVDTSSNSWKCFRDNHGGGGPAELIAVVEGIIDCANVGPSCFTAEQGRQIIEVARKKYGLKVPEYQEKIREPKGWALSIDIKRMAERHHLTQCPKCSSKFLFNDAGQFYCKACKYGGGLKKFSQLLLAKQEFSKC